MEKVYVVYADTTESSWGIELTLFGVATDEKSLDKIRSKVIDAGYIPNVIEMTPNELRDEYLGGYYE